MCYLGEGCKEDVVSRAKVEGGLKFFWGLFDGLSAVKCALVCTNQEELILFYIGGR